MRAWMMIIGTCLLASSFLTKPVSADFEPPDLECKVRFDPPQWVSVGVPDCPPQPPTQSCGACVGTSGGCQNLTDVSHAQIELYDDAAVGFYTVVSRSYSPCFYTSNCGCPAGMICSTSSPQGGNPALRRETLFGACGIY